MNTRVLALSGLLLLPSMAAAQSATPTYEQRGYVQIGAGAQSGTHGLTTTSTFNIYDEQASIVGSQAYGGGTLFNVGGGARVWRNLVASLNYSRNSDSIETTVVARVPHPLFTGRFREATQPVNDLKHTEDAYHVTLSWMIPFGDDLTLGVGAGPSFVKVAHEFASTAGVQETDVAPNFSTVALQNVTFTRGEKTATTVNVGADLTYNLPFDLGQAGRVGATLAFRYAGGTATLTGGGTDLDVKYGGVQFWGGLRVSF